MSLQHSFTRGPCTPPCARNPGQGFIRSQASARKRIEHLPVFRDFSGRIFHLAVSIKTGKPTKTTGSAE